MGLSKDHPSRSSTGPLDVSQPEGAFAYRPAFGWQYSSIPRLVGSAYSSRRNDPEHFCGATVACNMIEETITTTLPLLLAPMTLTLYD